MGLGLLLAGFAVAQAANPFDVQGTITAINDEAKTLMVDGAITVYTTDNTVVEFKSDTTLTYSFANLYTGLYVKVQAEIIDSKFTAIKICVPIKQTK